MKRFYSHEDAVRWDQADQGSIDVHREKLAGLDLPPHKYDFHLNMLSLAYHSQGMTDIAKGNFEKAINSFRASVETKSKIYERYEKGQGTRAPNAGDFQSLLVAFVTNDDELISRFLFHFRADKGTPGSIFLGGLLKSIAMNDMQAVKAILLQKRPRFEPQFVGYAECLDAISNKDSQGFVNALNLASESWAKWASKTVEGLPDSVCFIEGVGLIRLAERVFGNSTDISNEHIPREFELL